VFALAIGVVALRLAAVAFLPAPQPRSHIHRAVAQGAAAAAVFGSAVPVFAEGEEAAAPAAAAAGEAAAVAGEAAKAAEEGGFLNLGRIPLGGGFALNLDIPESGLVNLVILIAGLFYLLGPVLSESMSTREKEIQQDIDDAITKYDEAISRLAEAEKNKAQAAEVVAEIEASIEKDKKEFLDSITDSTDKTLKMQDESADAALRKMGSSTDDLVEAYIQSEAVKKGSNDIMMMDAAKKSKFLDNIIAEL